MSLLGANAATARIAPQDHARFSRGDFACLALIFVAALIVFVTAQPEGQQWWSDAPRHALNGAFIKDLIAALPWRDPQGWAVAYYLQYPALTILFYPPLFPVLEAFAFSVFDVSTRSALLTVAVCYFALGVGAYRLLERWMPRGLAAAAAVFFLGFAEVAYWGRQVMLDIPVYAFLVWALLWFLRFLDTDRRRDLFLAAGLFVAALYTKQTVAFIAPALAIVYWRARGWEGFRDRRLWLATGLSLVALIPLAIFTLKFGQTNVESVAGVVDSEAPRLSWAGLTYYVAILPQQIGWVATVLAALSVVALIAQPAWRPQPRDLLMLLLWFAIGYVFFWLIDLKKARFTTVILLPLAAAIYIVLAQAIPRRWRMVSGWSLALGSFAYTMFFAPVPQIGGYMEAAQWIRQNTAPGVVLFSGMRDGSFIFNLRSLDSERRYSVLRADKLLLELAIRREQGVREKAIARAEIAPLLTSYGVGYVVAERDFWTDLRPMALLQEVLDSDAFEQVARIPVTGNVNHRDKELRIYRNRAALPKRTARLKVVLPAIGRSFEGDLPQGAASAAHGK